MLLQQFGSGSSPKPDLTPTVSEQQRRIRRLMSNRESARRSRMRKQKHLEDLRCHVIRLRALNRELAKRVGSVLTHSVIVRSDNDQLRSESKILVHRFLQIQQILELQQRSYLPLTGAVCGGFGLGNEQQALASLIA